MVKECNANAEILNMNKVQNMDIRVTTPSKVGGRRNFGTVLMMKIDI